MNINHCPIFFLHIAKTAGTSFDAFLRRRFEPEAVAPFFGGAFPCFENRTEAHRLISGHYTVHQANRWLHNCVWLTFIRDPVARAVSQYRTWHNPKNLTPYWIERINPEQREAVELARRLDIEDYVACEHRVVRGSISNHQVRILCSFDPEETRYICSPAADEDDPKNRTLLQSAMDNLLTRFTFFGVTERYDASLALFTKHFNEEQCAAEIEALNVSDGDAPIITAKTKAMLESLNRLDSKLYERARAEFISRLLQYGIGDHAKGEMTTN